MTSYLNNFQTEMNLVRFSAAVMVDCYDFQLQILFYNLLCVSVFSP